MEKETNDILNGSESEDTEVILSGEDQEGVSDDSVETTLFTEDTVMEFSDADAAEDDSFDEVATTLCTEDTVMEFSDENNGEAAKSDEAEDAADDKRVNTKSVVSLFKRRKKGITQKKKWYNRSLPERVLTLIPAAIMLAAVIISWIQIGAETEEYTEFICAVAITGVATFLGGCCVRLGRAWGWIVTILTPAAVFLLTEFFTHNPYEMKMPIVVTNLVFYYGTAFLVLFLTGSMKASIVITAALPMIFGLVNYYVLEFRGSPLFPWDIASAGTAAGVVDNYSIIITWHICFLICAFMFIIMLGFMSTPRIKLKLWWLRAPLSILAAVALVMTGSFVQERGVKDLKMYPYLFSPKQVFKVNGAAVTYAYTLQYTGVQKPDSYSPENVQNMLDAYEGDPVTDETKRPNVIVIMNEAFSDLRTMVDYKQNKPVTPYIDAMVEDTVKGTIHVSVKGGNTANSEFEFLTGLSMTNFTPGSIPYQQYLTGETPTFAAQMSELGYKTVGMHPYGAAGWNRDDVYQWFGFDETYFLEQFNEWIGKDEDTTLPNFTEQEKVRNYYSDAATYQKIIDLYENKGENEPLFVFDVTMQNHGGYANQFENFTPDIFVSGLATRSSVNMYLSLVNKSDTAFGELVEYFKAQDEPTVILMFGDHQPHDSYVKPLLDKYNTSIEPGSLDEQLRRFTVPFVMWANYDIEEDTDVVSSVNFMSTLLCERAGIPMTSTQKYLAALYEKYPVICEGHYCDAEGNFFDASTLPDIPEIKDYSMLSYNMVTDTENILDSIYSYK